MLAAFTEIKGGANRASLIEGDNVATRWRFSFTNAEGVTRTREEIAWQTWRGDQFIEERFYYDPKTVGALSSFQLRSHGKKRQATEYCIDLLSIPRHEHTEVVAGEPASEIIHSSSKVCGEFSRRTGQRHCCRL